MSHPLAIAPERSLIIAGRGDRIVPVEHPTMLWEHWGRPCIHWLDGGHVAPFGRRAAFNAIATFLRGLGVV